MKTIYIHIGIGKTGTSSVQEFFFNNREEFARQGVYYPLTGIAEYAHHGLALFQSPEMPEGVEALYKNLKREISLSSANSVFISSEQFCFLKKPYVSKVKEMFSEFPVKIIFYVRDQCKLIESTYLEWQKAGLDYKGSIENFYNQEKKAFDFTLRLQFWIEEFGAENIVVRVYDKRIIGDDTCHDVMKLLKLETNNNITGRNIRSNPSLLPEFSNLLCILDQEKIQLAHRRQIIHELLALSKTFKSASTVRLIPLELREQIKKFYKLSNQAIAKQFLNEEESKILLNPESVFPAPGTKPNVMI